MNTELQGFSSPQQNNKIAEAEEAKATQEVQASLVIAKRFPRDERTAIDKILNACTREQLAATAVYQYSRSGAEVSGPSIRLAEAMALHWGNIDFGFRELSRGKESNVSFSEVEAYAWDKESNVSRRVYFRVPHWRDTKAGGYAIQGEREIYELMSNQAQRRVRSCILAIIPGDIADSAVAQCETTLRASADTSPEAVKKLLDAFLALGIAKLQIETRIQRRLEAITAAQVVQLRKIYASIRDGMSTPDEWFSQVTNNSEPSEAPREHLENPFPEKEKKNAKTNESKTNESKTNKAEKQAPENSELITGEELV